VARVDIGRLSARRARAWDLTAILPS